MNIDIFDRCLSKNSSIIIQNENMSMLKENLFN